METWWKSLKNSEKIKTLMSSELRNRETERHSSENILAFQPLTIYLYQKNDQPKVSKEQRAGRKLFENFSTESLVFAPFSYNKFSLLIQLK